MKRVMLFCLSVLILTFSSCGGGGSSPTPAAANDTSYKGVYKGVLAGSTGHFWLDIYNTDTTKATLSLTFDDTSKTMEGVQTKSGDNYVYTFSDSEDTFVFEVTPVGVVVPAGCSYVHLGHSGTITMLVDKATSTVDVAIWEGTWSSTDGSESGVWNMMVKGTVAKAIATDLVTTNQTYELDGTATTTTVTVTEISEELGTATGTIDGSSTSGTWTTTIGYSGTFTGSKTL